MPSGEAGTGRGNDQDVLYSISCRFTHCTRQIVYLLDRNIVSLIKDANVGKSPRGEIQRLMLENLRRLDSKVNFFSPMTSIAERNKKGIMDREQFCAVILDEAETIS